MIDDIERLYKLSYITGKSSLEIFHIAAEQYGFGGDWIVEKDFKRFLKESWMDNYRLPTYVVKFLNNGRRQIDRAPWTWLPQQP